MLDTCEVPLRSHKRHKQEDEGDGASLQDCLILLPFELRTQIYNYIFRDSTAVVTEVKNLASTTSKQTRQDNQDRPHSRSVRWILDQPQSPIRTELLTAFMLRSKWEIRCPYNQAAQLAPEFEQATTNKSKGSPLISFIDLFTSLNYSHLIQNLVLQCPVFESRSTDLVSILGRLPNLKQVTFTPGSWLIRGSSYPGASLSVDVPLCAGEPVFTDGEILDIFRNNHLWKTHSMYHLARCVAETTSEDRTYAVRINFLVREGLASGMGIVFPHSWECKVCTWDVDAGEIIGYEKSDTRNMVYLSGGAGVSVLTQQ